MIRYAFGLCVVLAACTSGGGGGGGNGGGGGGGGSGCVSCNPWQTCVGSTCVLSGSSQWDLIADVGVVSQKNSLGNAWDALGGLPDPKFCVTYNGARACTPARQDTLTPVWGTKLLSRVGAGGLMGGFAVEYIDEDLSSDDPICGGNVTIDAAAFSAGVVNFHCSNTASGFDFILTYAP